MSDQFNRGGGVLSFLSKVFDVIFLSVLWALFCIPIITIGPSTTALYYTTAKVIRRDRGYVWHEFWHAFKSNFVTGAIYTVVLAAFVVLLALGLIITQGQTDTTMKVARYSYIMLAVIISCGYAFLFPILSRFTFSKLQLFKMSYLVAFKHLPTTIFLVLMLFCGGTVMFYILPLVIILPAIISLLCSLAIEKVFKKYLPKPETGIPEDELKWYQTF